MNKTKKRILSTLTILAVAATATLGGLFAISGNIDNGFSPIAVADTKIENKTSEENATKYYVGTPAEGAEGAGKSADDPMSLQSLNGILEQLKPGDIVYVVPGVHKSTVSLRLGRMSDSDTTGNYINGNYDDFIVFKALDPDKETVLDFSEMKFDSTLRGVHIYGNYYYWSGIDICGAGDNGMYIGGNYNVVENCEFYNNRDTGLQLGRNFSSNTSISSWPNYNLIRNCTSHNNYDNETKGENADGFAAKLTVGYHNVFDGCIAYRNSDDGWDLYGKDDTGIIGTVYMINCVAFENGYLEYTQAQCNANYPNVNQTALETNQNTYMTANGDGNGFKLGGSTLEGDVFMYNCYSFNNKMHGVTDNSNPGVISVNNVITYNNSALIDNEPTSNTFGQIIGCDTVQNNIDIARSELSYNNFSSVLSVFNGRTGTGSDRYIGSGENSLLVSGNSWNKIEEPVDANTITVNNVGTPVATVSATSIFAELPAANLGLGTSKYGKDLHKEFRNEDGSVNMGNILKIKDYSVLGFEEREIGADLSLTKQAAYDEGTNGHFDGSVYTFLTDDSFKSESEAKAQAIYDMIYLPVRENAVYQDFDLATLFVGSVNVSWNSSNPSVISIADSSTRSVSGVTHVRATVYRDIETDHQVTLTATATVDGQVVTKTFDVTVKQNEYLVGDFVVDGVSALTNSMITTQYLLINEPSFVVYNAADYNGKILPEESYSVTSKYMYATSKGQNQVEIAKFTTANAGVYTITKSVQLNDYSGPSSFGSYTYTVYVVDQHGTLDFLTPPTVNVGYNNFVISGELNNVSGTLYAKAVRATDTYEPSIEDLKLNGMRFDITTDQITATFEADNSEAYKVYYAICNPAGELTSVIYSTEINVNEISDAEQLMELITSGGSSNVINKLTRDINLSNVTWNPGTEAFVGYLDGNNHTISNLSISASAAGAASFIYRLSGGTLININFNEIDLKNTENQVGLIAQAYSGSLVNIKITNINAHTDKQRVGGLIGQVFEANGTLPLIIDRISIINDDNHGITASDRRAAGIIGLIQVNSSPKSSIVDIRISNCYIDSIIGEPSALVEGTTEYATTQHVGGIVGSYDNAGSGAGYIESISLTIKNCYFVGTVTGTDRVGGIIGYQNGISNLTILNCVSFGDVYYKDATTPLVAAEKNSSGIFGGYSTLAPTSVSGCFAKFEDHNSAFFVETITETSLQSESLWTISMDFDIANIWQFNAEQAPYMTLR